jgi:ABC-type uncharacterized transport system substrate-binding protein
VLDCNTIIETKTAGFFEHIYPLKEKICYAPINDNRINKTHIEKVKSKRQRKEILFGNNFFTYLVDKNSVIYSEAISSFDFEKKQLKLKLIFIYKIKLGK